MLILYLRNANAQHDTVIEFRTTKTLKAHSLTRRRCTTVTRYTYSVHAHINFGCIDSLAMHCVICRNFTKNKHIGKM